MTGRRAYKRMADDGCVYEYVGQSQTLGHEDIVTKKIGDKEGMAVDDISEYRFLPATWHDMAVIPATWTGNRDGDLIHPKGGPQLTITLPVGVKHGDLLMAAGAVMDASATFIDWDGLAEDSKDAISAPGRILLSVMHQLTKNDVVDVER